MTKQIENKKVLKWAARAIKPKNVTIKPKGLNLELPDSTPTYWFDDSPFLTFFLTAFSATFPEGEKFMIDSVRMFRDQVKDSHPELYKECSGFIGQEAHHSKEHALLNDFLSDRGVPVNRLEKMIEAWVPRIKSLPKKDQMAITGAAEHLTALFGDLVLNNPEIIDKVDPNIRPLWVWHAIEEIEHKAVTYDLFEAVDGNYWRRLYGYAIAIALVGGFTLIGTMQMLTANRSHLSLKDTGKGLWWMFGFGKDKGYFRRASLELLDYLRPSYHPWKHDNSDLIEKWRPILDKMLEETQPNNPPPTTKQENAV